MMKCSVCGKAPPKDEVTLWRVNEKGVPGVWHCGECLSLKERRARDPELVDLTDLISGKSRTKLK